jgi:CubicO group peptidase (beta-lactamase class C family)
MDLEAAKPMAANAIFGLASMSKPRQAVATLTPAEKGRIRRSDPVSRFAQMLLNGGGWNGRRLLGVARRRLPQWA